MALVPISAFKNKIALVASGGKKSRGRYGDGCIYRQNGRSNVFMMTWYERQKLSDGTAKIVKKSKSSGSTDRSVALRQLRSILTRLGGRRPLATDPDKVSYDDLRANFSNTGDCHDLADCGPKRCDACLHLLVDRGNGCIEGIDGDCLAQACLFAAFAEFVATYGEEAAAEFAEGLAVRIRNGEFSLPTQRQ